MNNKFITQTNAHLGMLSSLCGSADNYEIQQIGRPIYILFELLIKQSNKINVLEKDIKRLKKLNQRPYQKSLTKES